MSPSTHFFLVTSPYCSLMDLSNSKKKNRNKKTKKENYTDIFLFFSELRRRERKHGRGRDYDPAKPGVSQDYQKVIITLLLGLAKE